MRRLALVVALVPIAFGCASSPAEISERDRTEIYKVLERQRMAWTAGSLVDFMDGYARSPDLVMAGQGEIRRGWQTLFDRYRASYAPDAMGRLTFGELEIQSAGPDSALVIGRWHLDDGGPGREGAFTLLFRRYDVGWRIACDHTSATGGS